MSKRSVQTKQNSNEISGTLAASIVALCIIGECNLESEAIFSFFRLCVDGSERGKLTDTGSIIWRFLVCAFAEKHNADGFQ